MGLDVLQIATRVCSYSVAIQFCTVMKTMPVLEIG